MSLRSLEQRSSPETPQISPELQNGIIGSFHELLMSPSVLEKVRATVSNIPDQVKRMQLIQSLNRILRIEDASKAIQEITSKRLHQLLTAVLIKDITPLSR